MRRHDPSSVLFPPEENCRKHDHALTEDLLAARRRLEAGPVTPVLDLAAFRQGLAKFDFATPQPLESTMEWVIAQLEGGIVHITHPRYFGLFNPKPTFPAQCADRIAGAFNPQLASSKTSPVAVEIETHVIGALARRAGLPSHATGHFTSGGSEANFTALVCALTKAHPEFAVKGARAFAGLPTFYVSRESHLAWIKIAHEAGIGRAAVRLVNTDGSGRLDPAALRQTIDEDRSQGCVPVMVVATAGTTGAGAIDPLAECSRAARQSGAWYHVDAAWGGALLVSEGLRGYLAGIELADSITIDAHKWLATTMGCGMFLAADAKILQQTFDVATSFMPSHLGIDPYVTSAQWSRRFMGLRLFLSLAAAGWQGYEQHIEHGLALASYARKILAARKWQVVNESPLAVLCILPPRDVSVERIVDRVLARGTAWVSVATYAGRKVIRACMTNGTSSEHDVDGLVEALELALTTSSG